MRYASYATVLAIPLVFCGSVTCAERAAYDSTSRIIALLSAAEAVQVSTSVVAEIPSGRRIPIQRGARRLLPALTWTQDFALPAGGVGRLDTKAEEDATGVKYTTSIRSSAALAVNAIEFVLDLPRDVFLKGRVTPQGAAPLTLTTVKPPDPALYRGRTSGVRVEDPAGNIKLDIDFDKPTVVSV